jgi:hypothetical protein
MDVSDPATMLIPAGTAAVLRVLAGAGGAVPFSVRRLAQHAGVTHQRAAQVVNRLSGHGLVLVEEAGGAKLCRFNTEHLAAPAVTSLVQLRGALMDLLRNEIAAWKEQPVHASLFGSAARGDGNTSSDLDILLIHPDGAGGEDEKSGWSEQLHDSGQRIHRRTGNWPSWFEVSFSTLRRAVTNKEPLVAEWRSDNVRLAGITLDETLRTIA